MMLKFFFSKFFLNLLNFKNKISQNLFLNLNLLVWQNDTDTSTTGRVAWLKCSDLKISFEKNIFKIKN